MEKKNARLNIGEKNKLNEGWSMSVKVYLLLVHEKQLRRNNYPRHTVDLTNE